MVVVLDRDGDDCRKLKKHLIGVGAKAGMPALFRIAIEELEAWLLGDIPALCTAYPAIPTSLAKRAGYRDPDAIVGGTWEALERALQRAGYYPTGMPKVEVASRVAAHMDPDANVSGSFCAFRDGLLAL